MIADKFSATRKNFWSDLKFINRFARTDDRILDYGCGNGRLLEILPSPIQYYGLDVSERLLSLAQKRYSGKSDSQLNWQKIRAFPEKLSFSDNYFDVVYSIAVFHHLPGASYRQAVLKELKRVLKPHGYLIVTVWNLWQARYRKRIFQNWRKKVSGKSWLDWNDCYLDFKDNQGRIFSRYHHAFTQRELKNLFQKENFSLIKAEKISGNIIAIGQK